MFEVLQSATFRDWLERLADRRARARIQVRIDRAKLGNLGDVKSLGWGLCEMRIDYGPGYRLYFLREGRLIVVLLCGGTKRTQTQDIARARMIALDWEQR